MTNKFSNFKPLGSRFAEIDITTGLWWWKRTSTVLLERVPDNRLGGIYKMFGPWYFHVGGHWCPPEVRECEREYYRRVR